MTALSVVFALFMWSFRKQLQLIRWVVVAGFIFLCLAMKAPVYYVMARIDFTGKSTGWYRAALIESSIRHLNEWWLAGTDYTRHWMETGAIWSENHADITNNYIKMGVVGGMPLMLLFIFTLAVGFLFVGKALQNSHHAPLDYQFMLWILGSILFGHVVTMISVSYFDQSIVFLYMLLAMIAALYPRREFSKMGNRSGNDHTNNLNEGYLYYHC